MLSGYKKLPYVWAGAPEQHYTGRSSERGGVSHGTLFTSIEAESERLILTDTPVGYADDWEVSLGGPTREIIEVSRIHVQSIIPRPTPEPQRPTHAAPSLIARLIDEVEALREEVAELRQALRWHDEPFVPLDAWQRWIEDNLDEIAKYEDEHIAIDPVRGIVHHDPDERAFGDWYEGLSDKEANQYLITHSAMYV